jgi:hypothetical protein
MTQAAAAAVVEWSAPFRSAALENLKRLRIYAADIKNMLEVEDAPFEKVYLRHAQASMYRSTAESHLNVLIELHEPSLEKDEGLKSQLLNHLRQHLTAAHTWDAAIVEIYLHERHKIPLETRVLLEAGYTMTMRAHMTRHLSTIVSWIHVFEVNLKSLCKAPSDFRSLVSM